MRQFLYLDNDIINSIVAQYNKGLIDDITTQSEEGSSHQKEKSANAKADGDVELNVVKLAKAEANLSIGGAIGTKDSRTIGSKEIITKSLHDSAFEIAYSVINPTKVQLHGTMPDLEEYIELTRVFDFIDLEYLDHLFAKNGLIDFIKSNDIEQIKTAANSNPKGSNTKSIINNQINELKKTKHKGFDDAHKMITILKEIVPYNRMLFAGDGYLIPVEDKYFRVNPTNMGFKYGGEIKCVGLITNVIGKETNPLDSNNIFATLQFSVNEALRSLLPTKMTDLYVVHPIAIYYEN